MFSLFSVAHAATTAVDTVAQTAGYSTGTSITSIIGTLINIFLGLLGVIFLILTIYAGWLWMTAQGDPKKVEKAQGIMTNAVIGLLICLSAYGITTWVVNALTGASGSGSNGGAGNGSVSTEYLSAALGSGAVRDHYPSRSQTDVPRNANIIVTFRDQMDISSLISGYSTNNTPTDITDDPAQQSTLLNADNVEIYTKDDQGDKQVVNNVHVSFSADLQTFVFNPDEYLGSPSSAVWYYVNFGTGVKNARGEKVLAADGGYEWSFATGTTADLTPPRIVSVLPAEGGSYAKNIAVQIVFDEAMDPTTVSGTRAADGSGFSSITTRGATAGIVPGTYEISNGYTTVSFTPATACGVNSCGETIYCLPASQSVSTTAYAADVGGDAPQATVPYNGIVDISGNSLDGNGDGKAGDDYAWSFNTTGNVNLSGPQISAITPNIRAENIPLNQDVTIIFNDVLLSSTVSSENAQLTDTSTTGESHDLWYRLNSTFLTSDGTPASSQTAAPTQTSVKVSHGTFLQSSDTQTWLYGMTLGQGIKNQYQNCYVPASGPTADGGTCQVSSSKPFCCNGEASREACDVFSQ